jgi:hypothetical protein
VSVAGGTPVEEDRTELGQCEYCDARVHGRWRYDLTPYTSIVEHCPGPDQPPEE